MLARLSYFAGCGAAVLLACGSSSTATPSAPDAGIGADASSGVGASGVGDGGVCGDEADGATCAPGLLCTFPGRCSMSGEPGSGPIPQFCVPVVEVGIGEECSDSARRCAAGLTCKDLVRNIVGACAVQVCVETSFCRGPADCPAPATCKPLDPDLLALGDDAGNNPLAGTGVCAAPK